MNGGKILKREKRKKNMVRKGMDKRRRDEVGKIIRIIVEKGKGMEDLRLGRGEVEGEWRLKEGGEKIEIIEKLKDDLIMIEKEGEKKVKIENGK